MRQRDVLVFVAGLMLLLAGCARSNRGPAVPAPPAPSAAKLPGAGASCASCPVQLNNQASSAFGVARGQQPGGCSTRTSNGFPLPDANCTPGAENPTVTLAVLKNSAFRTACLRDCVTTEARKKVTYALYGLTEPPNNSGNSQTCELDHLVPLELGGADTLDNIWPQCGPTGATLNERHFKQKDMVENYLAAQVKAGAMVLRNGSGRCAA